MWFQNTRMTSSLFVAENEKLPVLLLKHTPTCKGIQSSWLWSQPVVVRLIILELLCYLLVCLPHQVHTNTQRHLFLSLSHINLHFVTYPNSDSNEIQILILKYCGDEDWRWVPIMWMCEHIFFVRAWLVHTNKKLLYSLGLLSEV